MVCFPRDVQTVIRLSNLALSGLEHCVSTASYTRKEFTQLTVHSSFLDIPKPLPSIKLDCCEGAGTNIVPCGMTYLKPKRELIQFFRRHSEILFIWQL